MSNKGFNLLPKKSEDLIRKEKKRDSYSIYYTFLVFFGVVLWLGLVVFNSFVVDRSTNEWKDVNREKQSKINNEYAQPTYTVKSLMVINGYLKADIKKPTTKKSEVKKEKTESKKEEEKEAVEVKAGSKKEEKSKSDK